MMHRMLSVAFGIALAGTTLAQAPWYIFFETETAFDMARLKFIIESVKNADASADVFHSDDMRILQVRHNGGLGEAAYRQAIEEAGVALRPGTRTPEELGINAQNPAGVPVYVATGDDAGDAQRYRAAVEQWNAAHPDQQMSTTPLHNR